MARVVIIAIVMIVGIAVIIACKDVLREHARPQSTGEGRSCGLIL